MAQITETISKLDPANVEEREIKEMLDTLMSLAKAKADVFEEKISGDLKTGKMTEDLYISISKVTDRKKEIRAKVKEGPLDVTEIAGEIGEIISGNSEIMTAVGNLVKKGLDVILGYGEGQESESEAYAVLVQYPAAIVRLDFAFWGRNILAKGIKEKVQNVFSIVAFTSSVDVPKLDYNTFLTLYGPILNTAYGGDHAQVQTALNEAEEIFIKLGGKMPATDRLEKMRSLEGIRGMSLDQLIVVGTHRKF